jgi:hypothetical protein
MPEYSPNTVQTVGIDVTGEIASYEISGTWGPAQTIGLNIDANEAIDLSVDLGAQNEADESITWFDDAVTYSQVTSVRDGWVQAEEWIRLRVTTAAATAGSEATVYLARGE